MAHTITVNLDAGELELINAGQIALDDRIYSDIGRKVPGAYDRYEQNLALRKKLGKCLEKVRGEESDTTPQVHRGPVPNPAGNITVPLSFGNRNRRPKHLFSTWK